MVDYNRFRQTEDGKWIDLAQPWMSPLDNAAAFLTAEETGYRPSDDRPRPTNQALPPVVKVFLTFWGCVAAGVVWFVIFALTH